jgi:hypothetical protein
VPNKKSEWRALVDQGEQLVTFAGIEPKVVCDFVGHADKAGWLVRPARLSRIMYSEPGPAAQAQGTLDKLTVNLAPGH